MSEFAAYRDFNEFWRMQIPVAGWVVLFSAEQHVVKPVPSGMS